MFGMNRRVEEDLARIRRTNLPPSEQTPPAEPVPPPVPDSRALEKVAEPREKTDSWAIILAMIAAVGPFILIFVGVFAVLFFLLWLWMR